MEVKENNFLLLKFKGLEARRQFHRELDLRFKVHDAQLKAQGDFEDKMLYYEGRPAETSYSSPIRRAGFSTALMFLPNDVR
jgi:hypothetical protein